jgi:steroid 5-alpha reductase family enzyme
MRQGSTNDIAVVPAPNKLTFGTAVLLAAACCIPAVLSLVSMWNKILEINWKNRWSREEEDERIDELIEGTNGATMKKMKSVEDMIKLFLSVVEVPVYIGAVLTLLIIGELNFFSKQLTHQTENLRSIGKALALVWHSEANLLTGFRFM